MNCKAGDRAIVVGSLHTPENIGRIVDVVSLVSYGEPFVMAGGMIVRLGISADRFVWRVRCDRPLKWRVAGDMLFEAFEVASSDCFLRPISGIPQYDEQFDEVTQ